MAVLDSVDADCDDDAHNHDGNWWNVIWRHPLVGTPAKRRWSCQALPRGSTTHTDTQTHICTNTHAFRGNTHNEIKFTPRPSHVPWMPNAPRQHTCNQCGKTFRIHKTLRNHRGKIWTDARKKIPQPILLKWKLNIQARFWPHHTLIISDRNIWRLPAA